jgi:DNA-binding HxlR family transcriptional regulator
MVLVKMMPDEWGPLLGRKGMLKIVQCLSQGPQRPKTLIEKAKISRRSFYDTFTLLQEKKLVRPSYLIESNRPYPAYELTSEGYSFAEYVLPEEK